MAAFSLVTMGCLQADHNQYKFRGHLDLNITFEPIQTASTKAELKEFLKLVDSRNYGKKSRPGDVIGTVGGPQYRVIKVSESAPQHINQILKKIKIPVCHDMKIKKDDKIDTSDRCIWYDVVSVKSNKSGYKDLVLRERTYYE